jgi:hypothetical protein
MAATPLHTLVSGIVVVVTALGPWATLPAYAAPKTATITVSSTTRGAKVFVNDDEVGEVPLPKPIEVKPGFTYTVRIQKRGFTPHVESVLAGAGQNSEIEADLVPSGGIVKISSNIPRSQVLFNGKPLGLTPFDGDVPPGKYKLQVASAGYVTDSRDVDVKAGEPMAVDVTLVPVPKPVEIENKAIWAKWWFWTGVGAVVVGGIAGGVLATRETHVTPDQKFGSPDKVVTIP